MSEGKKAHPAEFKRRMVELVRAGRSPESLAREFEPSANTIRLIDAESDGTYGSPRVHAELSDQGSEASLNHVARVMAARTR